MANYDKRLSAVPIMRESRTKDLSGSGSGRLENRRSGGVCAMDGQRRMQHT